MAASNLRLRFTSGSLFVSRFRPSVFNCPRSPLLKVAMPLPPSSLQECTASPWQDRQELRTSGYQFDDDPLWLAVLEDLIAGLRSLVGFLAEQPGQLKHLEWPGFQNTMKTATLTLVLVALFVVVLSSVDAALCYMLAWLLRKSA